MSKVLYQDSIYQLKKCSADPIVKLGCLLSLLLFGFAINVTIKTKCRWTQHTCHTIWQYYTWRHTEVVSVIIHNSCTWQLGVHACTKILDRVAKKNQTYFLEKKVSAIISTPPHQNNLTRTLADLNASLCENFEWMNLEVWKVSLYGMKFNDTKG